MIDITAVPEFPYNDVAYLAENAIFVPDVLSYNDYYPFGMLIPGRHEASGSYRYGFQGQEKDDEIKGEGNSLNYTFRMHDPRVGRFFAVDPLTSKYPWYTPYSFSGNQVINSVEIEGLEQYFIVKNGEITHPSSSERADTSNQIFTKLVDAQNVAAMQKQQMIKVQRLNSIILEAQKNTFDFPNRYQGINPISKMFLEFNRKKDETNLASTVFPTIDENISSELNLSIGKNDILNQELLDQDFLGTEVVREKEQDISNRKKNIIFYSEEIILEDESSDVLFLESAEKITKRTVVAQLASEDAPRIFEVIEVTQMSQILSFIIESREVYVNGEKCIYQHREGAEFGKSIKDVKIDSNLKAGAGINVQIKTNLQKVD